MPSVSWPLPQWVHENLSENSLAMGGPTSGEQVKSREASRFTWSNFRGGGHQRPRPMIRQREQSHRAHRSHSSVATAGSGYSGTNTSARYLEASILRIPGLHLASIKTRNVREFRTHGIQMLLRNAAQAYFRARRQPL